MLPFDISITKIFLENFEKFIRRLSDQIGPQNLEPLKPYQSVAWLEQNEKFQSWARADVKRLIICGADGTGKTQLVRRIVSQLKLKHGLQSQIKEREVLVHFVDWKDKDRLSPTSVLRSFLFQLLRSNPDLFKQVYHKMHDPPIVYEDLEQLLVDLLSNSRLNHLELIIHAIDNMDEVSRDQIGRTLLRLIPAKSGMPHVTVLLSCKTCDIFSENIEASFSKLGLQHSEKSRLALEEIALGSQSGEEFSSYIKRSINAMPSSHRLTSEVRDLVRDCLLAKTDIKRESNVNIPYNVS